ncbi:MAG: DUF2335 domain-containing protein [Bacteroidaceae bacterium]|nr:DUF2335 domain-containing protein [Bacteroidaceae bacterium]
MSKRTINTRETQVATHGGLGHSLEQNYTIDDSVIPSPQELEQYKAVDPRFLDYFFDTAKKEQAHRHEMESQKLKLIRKSEGRAERINWWGMFFAFLSIVVCMGVAGLALYLDRPWFAGIFGGFGIISIVSIFVSGKETAKRE